MLTKMISDMPLPMPRWVMSSPSHMMTAVPAVMERMTVSVRCRSPDGIKAPASPTNWPLANRNVNPVDCSRARATVR